MTNLLFKTRLLTLTNPREQLLFLLPGRVMSTGQMALHLGRVQQGELLVQFPQNYRNSYVRFLKTNWNVEVALQKGKTRRRRLFQ